ncbi:uncharacterized protein LOC131647543 [Vicia villosa]|uniref:uncharacterized protein LOC131647543 n=1 Tax=Vicia villosa TaxID=3911 RepID=UPI00273CED74|nr:uncharacterized protein LOC131647543 [Vicia villosa]
MAISSRLGFPYLFITFTCNPTWPEIIRALSETGLQPHDQPDIITKVFKIKFDELIADITKKHVLGKVLACAVNRPAHVWRESWELLSDGVLHAQRKLIDNDYRFINLFFNVKYRRDEQRAMYKKIMGAVYSQNGAVFFLHGYGGTGKTYMWRTLATTLRSKHDICLTVATSGIASLLLPGGRTAHSKFKIPVPTLDNSTCKIEYNDYVGDLLRQTKLIIWDEAPMAHKHAFEALDRTLRDVMSTYSNSKEMFGGKVVVFGGDFRQILPVVPRGSRSDIVHFAINASYIWNTVQVLTLTKNMRLQSGLTENDKTEIQ